MKIRINVDLDVPRWVQNSILGLVASAALLGVGLGVKAWAAPIAVQFSQGEQLTSSKLNAALQDAVNQSAPPGSVIAFAGPVVPTGWLLCDGSLVSRTTYTALFAAIQVSFGVGDGVNTFALPDYRGRFLRGLDTQGANVLGEKSRTLGQYEDGMTAMPRAGWTVKPDGEHTHDGAGYLYASGSASNFNIASSSSYYFSAVSIPLGGKHSHEVVGGDAETRPANAAVQYLIRY